MKAKTVTAVLMMALGSMAAGCTGGGDDDDGGTLVNGLASVSLSTDGGQDYLSGAAIFWSGNPVSFNTTRPAAGTCTTSFPADIDLDGLPLLDAGATVTVTSPGGSFSLAPLFPGLYIGGTDSAGLFVANASHSITAPGGAGIDAYTHSQVAPGDLTVTSPDLSQSPLLLSIAQDLPVTWTSAGGTDLVFVSVEQDDADGVTIASVTCAFDDDGTGTIPASSLSSLDPGNLDNYIYVSKDRFSTFSTSAGTGLMVVSRNWSTDVDVQ